MTITALSLDDVQDALVRVRLQLPAHASVTRDFDRIQTALDHLRVVLARVGDRKRRVTLEDARVERHRLRTPLNQLIGYCELVQEELATSEWEGARRLLEELHTKSLRLARLVDELSPNPETSNANERLPEPDRENVGVVLVVDDSSDNLELLSRRLEHDGHEVLRASDGAEALALLETYPVDVVLLDVLMPKMDGYDTLDAIKRHPLLASIPVIMLTSLDDPQSVVRCLEMGAEDHLPKPFNAMLLRARIGSCLQKKRLHDLKQGYLERILAEKQRADDLLHGVIPIGVALAQERSRERLVEKILVEAQRFCGAQGGLLWLLDAQRRLQPVLVRCAAVPEPSEEDVLALLTSQMAEADAELPSPAQAAMARCEPVHISSLDEQSEYAMRASQEFCARYDYAISSLIAVPMRTAGGETVGVLELWNARHPLRGDVVPFGERTIEVLESLAALAAVAVNNYEREMRLREKIEQLEVRIDEGRRERIVSSITDTDYFQALQEKARRLRRRSQEGPR